MIWPHDQAILLINELISAEVQLVKEENNRKNGSTKKANRREQAAASAIFEALTGDKPTTPQLAEMVIL